MAVLLMTAYMNEIARLSIQTITENGTLIVNSKFPRSNQVFDIPVSRRTVKELYSTTIRESFIVTPVPKNLGKPKIRVVLESSPENLLENGYAILSCQEYKEELIGENFTSSVGEAESASTLTYQWSANGQWIEGAVQQNLRLTRLNRTAHHGVEYTCRAENDVGRSEATYKLNLRLPTDGPYFKSVAEKFIVSKGETITFSCTVDSNPAPTTYKWTKSGGVGRFVTTFGQNLSLDNIQPGHEGSYTCEVAVEGFPLVRQTHQLFVKGTSKKDVTFHGFFIPGPPKVVIENVPDAVEGGSAKIACKITGRPKSHDNVTWFKGRAMISTQMGHRFEYICRSKSSTASDVQVALDDLTPKYNTDTYSTAPMVDSMEGIGGKIGELLYEEQKVIYISRVELRLNILRPGLII
uniref:Ig-like domain-containing protein n=1 Tax=Romanomermis culicivorax TaxID=13658 RepID=A0A915HWV5_ROMCU